MVLDFEVVIKQTQSSVFFGPAGKILLQTLLLTAW